MDLADFTVLTVLCAMLNLRVKCDVKFVQRAFRDLKGRRIGLGVLGWGPGYWPRVEEQVEDHS